MGGAKGKGEIGGQAAATMVSQTNGPCARACPEGVSSGAPEDRICRARRATPRVEMVAGVGVHGAPPQRFFVEVSDGQMPCIKRN